MSRRLCKTTLREPVSALCGTRNVHLRCVNTAFCVSCALTLTRSVGLPKLSIFYFFIFLLEPEANFASNTVCYCGGYQ